MIIKYFGNIIEGQIDGVTKITTSFGDCIRFTTKSRNTFEFITTQQNFDDFIEDYLDAKVNSYESVFNWPPVNAFKDDFDDSPY